MGEPINLVEAFTRTVLCAPGWGDTVLAQAMEAPGPRLWRVVEHPGMRPGELRVLPPLPPHPWRVIG
jgi:hypothetical protein